MNHDTKLICVSIDEVFEAVQRYTSKPERYNAGWDVICECYGKRELQEVIDEGCVTYGDLLTRLADGAGLYHERALEAQAVGGQDVVEYYGIYTEGPLKPEVD